MLNYLVKDSLGNLLGAEAAAIFSYLRSQCHISSEFPESPLCVLTPTDNYASALCDQLRALGSRGSSEKEIFSQQVLYFPSWDCVPFEDRSPDKILVSERFRVLYKLQSLIAESRNPILVFSVQSLFQRITSRERLELQTVKISISDKTICSHNIIESLEWLGYQRVTTVEDVGQFTAKGSVIDLFSPFYDSPVRLLLSGTGALQSIKFFECETQRSVSSLNEVVILPVREFGFRTEGAEDEVREFVIPRLRELAENQNMPSATLRAYENGLLQGRIWRGAEILNYYLFDKGSSLFDYAGHGSKILFAGDLSPDEYIDSWWGTLEVEYSRSSKLGGIKPDLGDVCYNINEVRDFIGGRIESVRSTFLEESGSTVFEAAPVFESTGRGEQVSHIFLRIHDSLNNYLIDGFCVVVSVPSAEKRNWLVNLLKDNGLSVLEKDGSISEIFSVSRDSGVNRILVFVSDLSSGFFSRKLSLILFTEHELFNSRYRIGARKLPYKRSQYRRGLSSLSQLEAGDYVVHEQYGIGLFLGLKTVSHQYGTGDFLDIEYADGARLYVPVYDFSKVGKYSGPDGKPPQLTKLGTNSWSTLKARVSRSIAELTGMLLKTMAVRAVTEGYSYGDITPEDEWFAGLFQYQETPDQARTIKEVLSDMGSSKPMDRLVCGDVGYGKTEVAIRAAFKAVSHSRQVAILVPTTILAEQHRRTFEERFSGTPVRIAALSRFNSRKLNSQIIKELSEGSIDIVIGTHRLLQSDVIFKDLGLLVVDEEHRFGLAHKERFKQLRAELDVLSMSATPIPRSLQVALFGVRELSVIETAPLERQAVHTELLSWDDELIDSAIRRELARGGQVFVVHHLIEGLEEIANNLGRRIPGANIELLHGRIPQGEIEKKMHRFCSGESNVLVATSIIESGIDIPNANTIIILKAEQFGLADLYQLRGRVGRSNRQGYAYLIHSKRSNLSDQARRRLQAIASMDELGVGFRLAVQDMEIRGAGSLLGKDQSGHVQLLGYDMYMKILEQAVELERERRGMVSQAGKDKYSFPEFEPEIALPGDAHIPDTYIPDMSERLLLYQRSIEIFTSDELTNLVEEIQDRYGNLPDEVVFLFKAMLIRSICKKVGIRKLSIVNGVVRVLFVEGANKNLLERINTLKHTFRDQGFELNKDSGLVKFNISVDEKDPVSLLIDILGALDEKQNDIYL
ncbi:MAG TPA: transcription-repair coupling factor [Oligoflexia bacterium]|nr:transcription-repair coupling factor [Oligoflexia bacterium]HMP48810.1 transcription-repair coupling factor [Oligoflexia bacterium]